MKMQFFLDMAEKRKHPYEMLDKLPHCLLKRFIERGARKRLTKSTPEYSNPGKSNYSEEEMTAMINYHTTMHKRHSVLEIV
jgi:hypothetical protein